MTTKKIVHNAFVQPPMSCRRKTSVRIMIRIQIHATHAKKMIMLQSTPMNG